MASGAIDFRWIVQFSWISKGVGRFCGKAEREERKKEGEKGGKRSGEVGKKGAGGEGVNEVWETIQIREKEKKNRRSG